MFLHSAFFNTKKGEMIMEKETEILLLELGEELSENQKKEADAVKGYTRQLAMIMKAIELTDNQKLLDFLHNLAEKTEEKISDELNHEQGLLNEYVELTGIKISED